MQLPNDKDLRWFDYNKVARPSHEEHGLRDTFEMPLSKQLVSGNPRNWVLKGNTLHCDTDFGPLVQRINPGYVMIGVDDRGLPTFKKVL